MLASVGKRRLTTNRPAAATLPKRRQGRIALSKAILTASATRVVLVTRLSSAVTGAHTFHPAESFLRHPSRPSPAASLLVGAYPFITPLRSSADSRGSATDLPSSLSSSFLFSSLLFSSPVFRDASVPPPPAHSLQCDGGIDLKVHSCFHNAVSVPTLKRTLLCPPSPRAPLLSLSFCSSSSLAHLRVSSLCVRLAVSFPSLARSLRPLSRSPLTSCLASLSCHPRVDMNAPALRPPLFPSIFYLPRFLPSLSIPTAIPFSPSSFGRSSKGRHEWCD